MNADERDATPLAQFLEWDTNFFGFRIGRVVPSLLSAESMASVLEWCQRESIRCLYFSCDPGDDLSSGLAEREGFHLVDVRLDFSKQLERDNATSSCDSTFTIRKWRESDLPVLEAIAETAYRDTRFWHDSNFPRERVRQFYREWVSNSCRGFADQVLVAEHKAKPIGFVTCTADAGGRCRIGLVGVSAETQGRGVGKILVNSATAYATTRGCSSIEVATQARNLPAQRLYQRSGFTTSSTSLWYHLWR